MLTGWCRNQFPCVCSTNHSPFQRKTNTRKTIPWIIDTVDGGSNLNQLSFVLKAFHDYSEVLTSSHVVQNWSDIDTPGNDSISPKKVMFPPNGSGHGRVKGDVYLQAKSIFCDCCSPRHSCVTLIQGSDGIYFIWFDPIVAISCYVWLTLSLSL